MAIRVVEFSSGWFKIRDFCQRKLLNFEFRIIGTLSKIGHHFSHGLRTINEGINQRKLKIWADAADKMCFGRT